MGCCTLKVENVTLVSPNKLQVRGWVFSIFLCDYLILVKGFLGILLVDSYSGVISDPWLNDSSGMSLITH